LDFQDDDCFIVDDPIQNKPEQSKTSLQERVATRPQNHQQEIEAERRERQQLRLEMGKCDVSILDFKSTEPVQYICIDIEKEKVKDKEEVDEFQAGRTALHDAAREYSPPIMEDFPEPQGLIWKYAREAREKAREVSNLGEEDQRNKRSRRGEERRRHSRARDAEAEAQQGLQKLIQAATLLEKRPDQSSINEGKQVVSSDFVDDSQDPTLPVAAKPVSGLADDAQNPTPPVVAKPVSGLADNAKDSTPPVVAKPVSDLGMLELITTFKDQILTDKPCQFILEVDPAALLPPKFDPKSTFQTVKVSGCVYDLIDGFVSIKGLRDLGEFAVSDAFTKEFRTAGQYFRIWEDIDAAFPTKTADLNHPAWFALLVKKSKISNREKVDKTTWQVTFWKQHTESKKLSLLLRCSTEDTKKAHFNHDILVVKNDQHASGADVPEFWFVLLENQLEDTP